MADIVLRSFTFWETKLSDQLRGLLRDAEEEKWPFVPEEWQYSDREHAINVQDLLNAPSSLIADMTEKDVLLKCLKHAMKEQLYSKASAVAFLLDRYMYWSGQSDRLLAIVAEIAQKCPEAPIAPQIMIRKARLLKDQSAVQEADELLKYLVQNFTDIWHFRSQSQVNCVIATCVQIRGVIHHNLGLQYEAAIFILESLARYQSMTPEPDRKGISSSLGILADILCKLSTQDFKKLQRVCEFGNADCALLEAKAACNEAAYTARFQKLFFTRNKRHGGEALLTYLVTLPPDDAYNRKIINDDAVDALILSVRALSESTNPLGSKEQAFEYISAIFQLFIAYTIMREGDLASAAMSAAAVLYQRYCSSNKMTIADDVVTVNGYLQKLGVPELSNETIQTTDSIKFLQKAEYIYPKLIEDYIANVNPDGNFLGKQFSEKEIRLTSDESSSALATPPNILSSEVTSHESSSALATPPNILSSVDTSHESSSALATPPNILSSEDTSHESSSALATPPNILSSEETSYESSAVFLTMSSVDDSNGGFDKTSPTLPTGPLNSSMLVDPTAETCNRAILGVVTNQYASNAVLVTPIRVRTNDRDQSSNDGLNNIDYGSNFEAYAIIEDQTSQLENNIANNCVTVKEEKASFEAAPGIDLGERYVVREFDADKDALTERSPDHVMEQGAETVEKSRGSCGPVIGTYSYLSQLSEPLGSLGSVNKTLNDSYLRLTKSEIRINKSELTQQNSQAQVLPFIVHRARIFSYEHIGQCWSYQDTLVYVETELELHHHMKGNHRDVIKLQFLCQDEPRAQYLGKRYRKQKSMDEYLEDVRVQMIARHYVAVFNDKLKQVGLRTDHIQIVPAVHMQIVGEDGRQVLDYMNLEPFVYGTYMYVKLTNNTSYVNKHVRTEAATAFTHFTYQESHGQLMVVDLQGWVPPNRDTTIILTDPAINSLSYSFGCTDMGTEGHQEFWSHQHPLCNEVCRALRLERPPNTDAASCTQ